MKVFALAVLSLFSLTSAIPTPDAPSSDYVPDSCPQCNPNPGANLCHITTSCTFNWGHPNATTAPYYCACRAGFRANGCEPTDTTVQFQLPWYASEKGPSQVGRVFVKAGVECNTPCDNPMTCGEVLPRNECF